MQNDGKLFVGGIPHSWGNADLRDAFRRFGASRGTVMMDRNTGRSRGFGFVFVAREAADDAVDVMHGKTLEGRRVSVTKAVPEQHTQPGTPANMLGGGRGRGRGGRGRGDGDGWRNRGHNDWHSKGPRGPPRDRSRGRPRFGDRSPSPRGRRGASHDGSERSYSGGPGSRSDDSRPRRGSSEPSGSSRRSDDYPPPRAAGSPTVAARGRGGRDEDDGGDEHSFAWAPPWADAESYLLEMDPTYDPSFGSYGADCKVIDTTPWERRPAAAAAADSSGRPRGTSPRPPGPGGYQRGPRADGWGSPGPRGGGGRGRGYGKRGRGGRAGYWHGRDRR